ncbi:MAG TPA: PIG-L family deacetylase [Kineosporiaceae bacterium]|nr:PIG-L family deacetylase [Kineosporiaceae bacterium]
MTPSSTVVVLHAHPDDEAIFTGATIRTLADAGNRVVLVTATGGEEGVPRIPLRPGETLRERRIAELERAAELLGVARLVLLGHRDSGAHAGPFRTGSLAAAPATLVARQVEGIVAQEQAGALVHYDTRGIYGHVDHVQVHRAGARVVRRLGITGYEATVDAGQLRRGPRHVLQQAAGDALDAGVDPARIALTVQADTPALLAKMAAMAAHGSQIGPEYLDPNGFAEGYRREWFVRRGPAVIEPVLTAALGSPRWPALALAGSPA